ncbi:hypothetical protein EYF80_057298 [Liparis tanakae]|uniref:Uncharacterized protein n=1 Tax=Liparis tanakae TaxID=230148 RepID=A0A4Z2EVH1_9TELE|nr:hypothetical protein EYF80_057298 [Liparis tanakae]
MAPVESGVIPAAGGGCRSTRRPASPAGERRQTSVIKHLHGPRRRVRETDSGAPPGTHRRTPDLRERRCFNEAAAKQNRPAQFSPRAGPRRHSCVAPAARPPPSRQEAEGGPGGSGRLAEARAPKCSECFPPSRSTVGGLVTARDNRASQRSAGFLSGCHGDDARYRSDLRRKLTATTHGGGSMADYEAHGAA